MVTSDMTSKEKSKVNEVLSFEASQRLSKKNSSGGNHLHDNIVYNIKDELKAIRGVTPLGQDNYDGSAIPDVVVRVDGVSELIVLEVKTNKADFKKSFYQCLDYNEDGYCPYVLLRNNFDGGAVRVARLYKKYRTNIPGLIKCYDKKTRVYSHPRYENLNYN
jgi:hypothetical protein